MWSLYILLCNDNSLYTGVSNNIEKRFFAHQNGTGAKYTRAHKPIRVIYSEEFETQSAACKRESEIKSWPREKKIAELQLQF